MQTDWLLGKNRLDKSYQLVKVVIMKLIGRKVAITKPIEEADDQSNRCERAKAAIRKMRQGVTLGDEISVKELIEEGRR